MHLVESSSWILSSLLVVIPSVLICLFLLWLVRKWISVEELKTNHDVAGFTLGIIGVLYSVILGFTVVNVQNRFNEVLQTIHIEAISLADLYREAAFFPIEWQIKVRLSIREYVQYVIEKEWNHQAEKTIRIEAHEAIERLCNRYYQVELDSEKTKIWYQEAISKLNTFMDARLSRLFNSWEHLGNMMWTILILGGVITICFMFFFGLERLRAQMIMTALLAGYISLMLYLVFYLDNVFIGPEGITSEPFQQLITLFDHWDHSKV